MKIAWFSPLPPQHSGISEYSVSIVKKLINYTHVDLWTEGDADIALLPTSSVFRYDRMDMEVVLQKLQEYDTVIYNMGNNYVFHKHMYDVLRKFPGVVILHDYVMHHFFMGYFMEFKNNIDSYFGMIRSYYGPQAEKIIKEALIKGEAIHESDRVINYPLCEPIILRATAIITHTRFVYEKIRDLTLCPIMVVRHPPLNMDIAEDDFQFEEGKLYIFIGGEITPNKMVDKVVEAFSDYRDLPKLRHKIKVLIVGDDKTGKIKRLIEAKGLNDIFLILGRKQQEAVFNYYIKNSHICINLRYPTMGESSGVLQRCMQFGKPTIVTKIGFYEELPNDIVIKIPYGQEKNIPHVIKDYIENSSKYFDIGKRAKEYVEMEHSLEKYILSLMQIIDMSKIHNYYQSLFMMCLDEIKGIIGCPKYEYEKRLVDDVVDFLFHVKPKDE